MDPHKITPINNTTLSTPVKNIQLSQVGGEKKGETSEIMKSCNDSGVLTKFSNGSSASCTDTKDKESFSSSFTHSSISELDFSKNDGCDLSEHCMTTSQSFTYSSEYISSSKDSCSRIGNSSSDQLSSDHSTGDISLRDEKAEGTGDLEKKLSEDFHSVTSSFSQRDKALPSTSACLSRALPQTKSISRKYVSDKEILKDLEIMSNKHSTLEGKCVEVKTSLLSLKNVSSQENSSENVIRCTDKDQLIKPYFECSIDTVSSNIDHVLDIQKEKNNEFIQKPSINSINVLVASSDIRLVSRTPKSQENFEIIADEAVSENNEVMVKSDYEALSKSDLVSDQTDIKKDADVYKAVTFAEDKEIFDLTSKVHIPITVSLDTPVYLVEPAGNVQCKSDILETVEENYVPTSDQTNFQFETNKSAEKDKGNPQNRAVHLSNESDIFSSDKIEDSTFGLLEPIQEVDDITSGDELKSPEAISAAVSEDIINHKEFIVVSVDESEIKRTESRDLLVNDPLSLQDDEKNIYMSSKDESNSVESIRHDTIGPLDNPVFLRELQYCSQHFDEEDGQEALEAPLPPDAPSQLTVQPSQCLEGQDSGWAWMVLAATCMGQVILGGSVYSAGVLLTAIVEKLNVDLSTASWVGSVHVCALSFSGPLVGSCLKKFGNRAIVCIAGAVSCFGFLGAAFATTVGQFVLTHGVIAGVGAGFAINPIFVCVGQYFCRHRAIACGMLACGAGMGMLTGAAFMSFLVDFYGLTGAYIMWAGIVLHLTVVGMLMRPSPVELQRLETIKEGMETGSLRKQNSVRHDMSVTSGINSLFCSVNHSMMSGMDRVSNPPKQTIQQQDDRNQPLSRSVLTRSINSVSTNHSIHTLNKASACASLMSNTMVVPTGINSLVVTIPNAHHNEMTEAQPMQNSCHNAKTDGVRAVTSQNKRVINENAHINHNSPLLSNTHLKKKSQSISSTINEAGHKLPNVTSTTGRRQRRLSRCSHYASTIYMSQYNSTSHIPTYCSLGNLAAQPQKLSSQSAALITQLQPQDAVRPRQPLGSRSFSLMGSLAILPTSLAMVQDELYVPPKPSEMAVEKRVMRILQSLVIFKNKPFLLYLLVNLLWAFGESPVMIFLSEYAMSRGTSRMQAAFLYTTMGIGSMSGRLLCGLVAGIKEFGPVPLFMGSLAMSGALMLLFPHVTVTFAWQAGAALILGLYTGGLVPCVSLITIELLGIAELGLGFGFLSLAQGCGYLIGPPLAGLIVAAFGFSQAFALAGVACLLGSAITFAMIISINRSGGTFEEERVYLHTNDDVVEPDSNINVSNSRSCRKSLPHREKLRGTETKEFKKQNRNVALTVYKLESIME